MQKRLLTLLTALIVFVGLAPAEETCKIAGLIFGIDPMGGTLLLKDPGGYLKNVKVESGTVISKLPVADVCHTDSSGGLE